MAITKNIIKRLIFTSSPLKKLISLSIIFSVILLFLSTFLFKTSYSQLNDYEKEKLDLLLSGFSKREKKNLSSMITHTCLYSEIPYTLFGNKPMSFALIFPLKEITVGVDEWKKIEHKLGNDTFICHTLTMRGHDVLFVANLNLIKRVYSDNKDLFERKNLLLQSVITCIKDGGNELVDLLKDHLLTGVLLGYGRDNAETWTMHHTKHPEKATPLKPFSNYFYFYYFLSLPQPVAFACDPHSKETKKLKKLYSKDWQAIYNIHKNRQLANHFLLTLRGK